MHRALTALCGFYDHYFIVVVECICVPLCAGDDVAVHRKGSAVAGGDAYSLKGSSNVAAGRKLEIFVINEYRHDHTNKCD